MLLVFSANAQYTPGQVFTGTDGYIEYYPGNIPVIISAPHGGDLEPLLIPDRNCSGCVTGKDGWTLEVAYELDSAIQSVFGGYPHIIINRLHRRKLDANREIVEAAQGDPSAEIAWGEYHEFIQAAKDKCNEDFGTALYIDLHAHGHPIQRIELGYLLTKPELQFSNMYLDNNNFQDSCSIQHLSNIQNPTTPFSEILRGNECMGAFLESHGYPSVPSNSDPFPATPDPYFSGGYNTARHGSRDSSDINGIQFELNYTGIRNTNANRHAFARAMACVMKNYLNTWYFPLDAWDPGNIVTTSADNGPGSLRSALLGATDGDVITFDPSLNGDTIQLVSQLIICSDVTIEGPGASLLAISGSDVTRILSIPAGANVQLKDLAFIEGNCSEGEDGGAMFIAGSAQIYDCIIHDNFADDDGGAIALSGLGAFVEIQGCEIYDNSCGDDGGAIRCWEGVLDIRETSIHNNVSPSFGGAISSNGTVTIEQSTFSNNVANGNGGAIRQFTSGQLSVSNSTLANNQAGQDGGAISSSVATTLNFCTIAYNEADDLGGGISVSNQNSTIENTLIALNVAPSSSNTDAENANFNSGGYNFIGDSTGGNWVVLSSDLAGDSNTPLNPEIGSLANNGGTTETIELYTNSPCVDGANAQVFLPIDQRDFPRPSGITPDIGAFELCQETIATDSIFACDSVTWIDGLTYYQSTSGISFALQNVNGCDSVVTLELEIPEIDVTITNVNNILSVPANDTIQWYSCAPGFVAIPNETNATFIPTANGEYAAVISVPGCSDTTDCIIVSTLSLTIQDGFEIEVFPNPTDGVFTISCSQSHALQEVQIMNALGEVIQFSKWKNENEMAFLLPKETGVYFIEITAFDGSRERRKIVKM
jgi:predicted outer membrane repeat protein